jgi:hypothetical protein
MKRAFGEVDCVAAGYGLKLLAASASYRACRSIPAEIGWDTQGDFGHRPTPRLSAPSISLPPSMQCVFDQLLGSVRFRPEPAASPRISEAGGRISCWLRGPHCSRPIPSWISKPANVQEHGNVGGTASSRPALRFQAPALLRPPTVFVRICIFRRAVPLSSATPRICRLLVSQRACFRTA